MNSFLVYPGERDIIRPDIFANNNFKVLQGFSILHRLYMCKGNHQVKKYNIQGGRKIAEKATIEQVQRGNTEKCEEIIDEYQDYIYSLCLGIVRNPHTAADITQDVFIKIYTSIGTYNHQGFKTWISRIATNTSIDYIRKRTREEERTISLDLYKESISLPSALDTPESLFFQKDQQEKLLSACEGLPPKYRDVIKKYYIENKSYLEISEEENITVRAVESRLYRGKKIIKRRWEAEGYSTFT